MLGAVDQLSDSFGRSEELADDSSDQRQAEADVQAGDDPAQCRRDDHLGGQLSIVSAQDARVGDEVALDLTHALEGVEEHDEEDEDRRGRDLGADVEPERDGEQGTQDHARDRVRGFDVDREDVGQQAIPAHQHADHHSRDRADDESPDGFLHRHQHLPPQRAQRGLVCDPHHELVPDPGWLAPEKGIDDRRRISRGELPRAEHYRRRQETKRVDVELVPAAGANAPCREVGDRGCSLRCAGLRRHHIKPRRCASAAHSSPVPRPSGRSRSRCRSG